MGHKPLREQPAFDMAFATQGKGEVDFAVSPAISHWPMALCTVEQLLVFTLFY
jgi:hypothetical protein